MKHKLKRAFLAAWNNGLRGIFAVVVGTLLVKNVPGLDPATAQAAGQATAASVDAAVQ